MYVSLELRVGGGYSFRYYWYSFEMRIPFPQISCRRWDHIALLTKKTNWGIDSRKRIERMRQKAVIYYSINFIWKQQKSSPGNASACFYVSISLRCKLCHLHKNEGLEHIRRALQMRKTIRAKYSPILLDKMLNLVICLFSLCLFIYLFYRHTLQQKKVGAALLILLCCFYFIVFINSTV